MGSFGRRLQERYRADTKDVKHADKIFSRCVLEVDFCEFSLNCNLVCLTKLSKYGKSDTRLPQGPSGKEKKWTE